ncbi:MAG: hypothetical protein DMG57_35150 [Acidobacteria bacterium]|nr:MAG: hypothetical protein DMG57_35150 [Acidobacteriota bacterium]
MRSKTAFASIVLFLIPHSSYSQANKTRVTETQLASGRIVDLQGRPRCCVVLTLVPINSPTAMPITAFTKYDGSISFSGLQRISYELSIPGGDFSIHPARIDAPTAGDLEIGDVVVEPAVSSNFNIDQVLVDRHVVDNPLVGVFMLGRETAGASDKPQDPCWVHADRYKTVEEFVGRGAQRIRATRVTAAPTVRADGTPVPIAINPDSVRADLLRVWLGYFRFAACSIMWAEGAGWSVEAQVEYPDHRNAFLRTNGMHTYIRDRDGRNWYIRLWPAVD